MLNISIMLLMLFAFRLLWNGNWRGSHREKGDSMNILMVCGLAILALSFWGIVIISIVVYRRERQNAALSDEHLEQIAQILSEGGCD